MNRFKKICLFFVGLLSVIWFLVRVIPKPSRASYPCQRAVFPIASAFVIWILSVIGSVTIFKKLKASIILKKYSKTALLLVVGAIALMFVLSQPVIPSVANTSGNSNLTPIGEARGIFPGRVVWTYDKKVTSWDGQTGHYWDANFTDQKGIDKMLSSSLHLITGQKSDKKAWDALFVFFNKNHNKSDLHYSEGQKIVIKINMNTARKSYESYEGENSINATPQVVLTMVRQLVDVAGVPDSCITVFDGTRYITDNIYDLCRKEFHGLKFVDKYGKKGRIQVRWKENQITYAVKNTCGTSIATCVTDADYIINMALFKGHNVAGITSCGKNHFGSINKQEHYFIRQSERGPGVYNPIIDLMGHNELGQKTLLFMVDAIYGSKDADPAPEKWQMEPFNNNWPSSIFLSLDNVAIESVIWDFFNTEIGDRSYMKYSDSYLHEASQADNPPSKTIYAPNGDNVQLKSLGVHEHWNNVSEKKYSRNLGSGNGIELVRN